MSSPENQLPPLPRVVSPPGWSWHYFRIRYLPTAASGLALLIAGWLWAMNLPEPTGNGPVSNTSNEADAITNSQRHANQLVSTNITGLRVLTNGNLNLGGGLVESD